MTHPDEGRRPRGLRIQTTKRSIERSIYRDTSGRRKQKQQPVDPQTTLLKAKLEGAGVNWNEPLSAATYQDWRDHEQVTGDAVRETGKNLLTLTTTVSDADVAQESLTVRESDFHPVARTISFRDTGNVEIAELDYQVLPWSAASDTWFEPAAQPSSDAVPKEAAKRPEFKVCKFTAEAIITEGSDKGETRKVCSNPTCPVHHPKQQPQRVADDAKWKAEQEKQRREQAIANTTGLRVLAAVSKAVPVRLMKRDLLFILEKLVTLMDERRVETLARQHGIRQKRDDGGIGKTLAAFLRRADEGTLSRLMVEAAILLAASRTNPATVLRDAASTYKVDTDAIALKVKQEFAAKEKAKKATAKVTTKAAKKAA